MSLSKCLHRCCPPPLTPCREAAVTECHCCAACRSAEQSLASPVIMRQAGVRRGWSHRSEVLQLQHTLLQQAWRLVGSCGTSGIYDVTASFYSEVQADL